MQNQAQQWQLGDTGDTLGVCVSPVINYNALNLYLGPFSIVVHNITSIIPPYLFKYMFYILSYYLLCLFRLMMEIINMIMSYYRLK